MTKNDRLLRVIALYKLFKVFTLIAAGFGALHMVHHNDAAGVVTHLAEKLGFSPGNHYLDLALAKIANVPPEDFREVGIGSFIYAALFLTEGIGLWLMKPWAEWFTALVTASLIPLELVEIFRRPTAGHVVVLLLNAAVVGYLVLNIRKEQTGAEG